MISLDVSNNKKIVQKDIFIICVVSSTVKITLSNQWLMSSVAKRPFDIRFLWKISNYCYYSVNVITFVLSPWAATNYFYCFNLQCQYKIQNKIIIYENNTVVILSLGNVHKQVLFHIPRIIIKFFISRCWLFYLRDNKFVINGILHQNCDIRIRRSEMIDRNSEIVILFYFLLLKDTDGPRICYPRFSLWLSLGTMT